MNDLFFFAFCEKGETMNNVIPQSVTLYFTIMTILATVVPILICLIYVLVKKEKVTTVLVGALTFFVFAMILEAIPKSFLLVGTNPVGVAILSSPLLTSVVAALLAGIFEETGRFVAFKFLLKKRTSKTTATAYGLGHGLFEVMLLVGYASIQYLVYISMINSGTFETVLSQVEPLSHEQAAALAMLPAQLSSVSFAQLPLAIMERTGAVLFHLGASLIVFYAVRGNKKGGFFFVAILLHTCLDILAGLAATGVITNMYLFECLTILYGLATFAIGFLLLKKMPEQAEVPEPVEAKTQE